MTFLNSLGFLNKGDHTMKIKHQVSSRTTRTQSKDFSTRITVETTYRIFDIGPIDLRKRQNIDVSCYLCENPIHVEIFPPMNFRHAMKLFFAYYRDNFYGLLFAFGVALALLILKIGLLALVAMVVFIILFAKCVHFIGSHISSSRVWVSPGSHLLHADYKGFDKGQPQFRHIDKDSLGTKKSIEDVVNIYTSYYPDV